MDLHHDYIRDHYETIIDSGNYSNTLCRHPSFGPEKLLIPDNLFHNMSLVRGPNEWRSAWNDVATEVFDMVYCRAAQASCRSFRLDLPMWDNVRWTGGWVMETLGFVVSMMTSLETLEWTHAYNAQVMRAFTSSFDDRRLDTVKDLRIVPGLQSLLNLSPNLETLSVSANLNDIEKARRPQNVPETDGPEWGFLRAAAGMNKLKHFDTHTIWTDEMISGIYPLAPRFTSLGLDGMIS
jgi:hypothetical protein